MIRRLKVLGLTLVALCAIAGASSVAAEAAPVPFSWQEGATTATATATGTQTFTTEPIVGEPVDIKCDESSGAADLWSASQGQTLVLTNIDYSLYGGTNCGSSVQGYAPEISMNGCKYILHSGESSGQESASKGTLDIACPAGSSIEIGNFVCLIKIDSQSGLGPVAYETTWPDAAPRKVSLTATLSGISYSFAGLCGEGSKENGSYSGEISLRAEDAGGNAKALAVGLPLAGEQAYFSWQQGATRAPLSAIAAQEISLGPAFGTVRCNEMSGEAVRGWTPSASLDVTQIEYSNNGSALCKSAIEGYEPTIQRYGCFYVFHAASLSQWESSGTMDIVCPPGNAMIIGEGTYCTAEIGSQSGLGPVYYSTREGLGGVTEVIARLRIVNLSASIDGICGQGSTNNNGYQGEVVLRAEDSSGIPKSIFVG